MSSRLWSLILLFALAVSGHGQDPVIEDPEAIDVASDDIGTTLERQESLRDYFDDRRSPEWVKRWREKRQQVLDKVGMDFSAAYDALLMVGIGGGEQIFAGSGELSLTGNWQLFGEERKRPFDLHFRVRSRHSYGSTTPAALAGEMGALWGVTDGFTDGGFEIPEFYFRQRFETRNLELRVGQMSIDSQLDRHALRGAKRAFLNQAFSSNPAVPFPRFGAGATLHWKHDSGFDLTIGATTMQATKGGDQIDLDFGTSDFFEAIQFGYDFAGRGGDPARVQLMLWNADAIEEEGLTGGSGMAFTVEQEIKDAKARLFLRGAWADDESSELSHLLAGGIGVTCRDLDLLGVALGVGQSSDSDQDWQIVTEAFYRWQFLAEMHITPSVQLITGQGFNDGHFRIVPGIRGQLSF